MRTWESSTDGRNLRFGIVVSRFNHLVSVKLLEGCHERLLERGARPDDIHVAWVPGAFELPLVARAFAHAGKVDAVLCFGAVIRGDTGHYDFVAGECASGIQEVQLETGVPCAFGVITCDTMEQALARAGGGKRDQGRNAALTVARMALLKQEVNPYRWQVGGGGSL